MNLKVSIITPTYNSESFIQTTIRSVIDQTYTNWELLIIDDASTDNTLNIVNKFTSKHKNKNIYVIKNHSNQGAAITRNQGIENASGDIIAFLDSDDVWKPSKLEKQVKFMINHDIDVCFTSYDLMDEDGVLMQKTVKALPKLTYKKLLKCNYIGNLTGMYNTKSLGKIYSPNLRKRQDRLAIMVKCR
ncbi:glycosyltransferase family 2 protein [Hyunsoonleella pacifica]|uniref:glycosyltransferase family 2 protein n=1 Tax=Hyunsoonleella pacifica TaxID=1080224 RepID=UPI0019B4C6DE|nr:glycosyltransferase family 2 protein [Hyunsoonleella pacifica]GGD16795.1 hypothetical protein GCM10011368_18440 [Hyunsoonleella pacifica]